MRLIFAFLLIASPASATPADPTEPSIIQFNGHSLRIEFASDPDRKVPTKVQQKADRACASVGKKAEAQVASPISQYRSSFFFICL